MTDSQVKFQQIMEDQRHNLAMEKYAKQEQESKRIQALASQEQAAASTQQVLVAQENAISNRISATAAAENAATNRTNAMFGIFGKFLDFVVPDANTSAKVAGEVITALMR